MFVLFADAAYLPRVMPVQAPGTGRCYLTVAGVTGEKGCKCQHVCKSFVFSVSCPCPVPIFLLGFWSFFC